MELPHFRYHPNPLLTGSIKEADKQCAVCGQSQGYIYTSHVYSKNEYHERICPWCIADGTAHEKLGVYFTDEYSVSNILEDNLPESVVEELVFRTPGFSGWQQERWFTHCADAAAFLGRVGYKELIGYGRKAIKAIRNDTGLSGQSWIEFMLRLDKDGSPTAYLFQCLHCHQYGGYTDCDRFIPCDPEQAGTRPAAYHHSVAFHGWSRLPLRDSCA